MALITIKSVITPAQLRICDGTPVTVLPAPRTGFTLWPLAIKYVLRGLTTPYDDDATLALGTGFTFPIVLSGAVENAAGEQRMGDGEVDVDDIKELPLVLTGDGAMGNAGTGTLYLYTTYTTLRVAALT